MASVLHFSDNFFSAGITDILDEKGTKVGDLDLKGAFSSSVEVHLEDTYVTGKFKFFSNRWYILDETEQEVGHLKQKLSFLGKKFQYHTNNRGSFFIDSEAFSREYQIYDEQEQVVAIFEKTSVFFQSASFKLSNYSEVLSNEELITVIMGVNMIHKRNSSNN